MTLSSLLVGSIFLCTVSARISTVDFGQGQKLTAVPSVGDQEPTGYTFNGIKYGTANRFEDSVVNYNHTYLNDASRNLKGDLCIQVTNLPPWTVTSNTGYSEDCLFLDIYVPPGFQDGFRLPVFMWSWGSQSLVGGRGTPGAGADLAKELEAIVVIPQFRVGPFGYLSTGDEAAPGNYALSDLKTAFRWVYENIQKFNGDKSRITLTGHSDAGALVSAFHLTDIQELSRKVYATMTMSGSVLSPWAMNANALDVAKILATAANCPESPSTALVACLKALDATTLEGFAESLLAPGKLPNPAPGAPTWGLVLDKKHIPGDPAVLLREKLPRQKTTGGFIHHFLKFDASIVAFLAFKKENLFGPGKPALPALKGLIIGKIAQQVTGCLALPPATIELIANTYGMVAGADDVTLRNATFQLITDINYGLPSIKEAMIYAETGAARWSNLVTMMSFDNDISAASPITKQSGLGAYHTCDLGFSLAGTMSFLTANQNDAQVTQSFRDQYREIVLSGTPLVKDNRFNPAVQNYLELGQDKVWAPARFTRATQLVKFWDRLKELKCQPPTNIPVVPAA